MKIVVSTINHGATAPLQVSPEENSMQTVRETLAGAAFPLNHIVAELLLCLSGISWITLPFHRTKSALECNDPHYAFSGAELYLPGTVPCTLRYRVARCCISLLIVITALIYKEGFSSAFDIDGFLLSPTCLATIYSGETVH